ncbi:MAG TPA: hypothetical protein PK227_02860 [Thermomonas sp.]|uniref:hypothetical protein n=1 Tax=Thermomonas sp. TaxID=1971895 RepID=UPI002B5DB8E6|nr:hypothetical protein [Thermomonas sp.]
MARHLHFPVSPSAWSKTMKNQNVRAIAVLASLAGLVACSQPAPPTDNVDKDQKAAIAAPAAPASNTQVEQGVTFSVEPANVYACEGRDRTTSVVKWDVQRPDVNSVKVLVSDATNPEKKTLAVMSPKGEAKTGEWVIAGLVVELVNAESGAQLAKHTVAALPCN